jgi:hypothetical protein
MSREQKKRDVSSAFRISKDDLCRDLDVARQVDLARHLAKVEFVGSVFGSADLGLYRSDHALRAPCGMKTRVW